MGLYCDTVVKKSVGWSERKVRPLNGRAARADRGGARGDECTGYGGAETYLKILHLFGPMGVTWLDASSMEMKRLRASFHLSLSLLLASGAEAPGAPFWVLPCLPKRWMALRMGPWHPLAQRERVTGSQVLPFLSVRAAEPLAVNPLEDLPADAD